VTTDETVIYEIDELDIDGDLKEDSGSIPEMEEVKEAINNMKQETTPGIMGLTSYMLKALPEKALEHLALIVHKFRKEEEDHEVWHTMPLVALNKGKGKTNDPNNLRGVCLKETHFQSDQFHHFNKTFISSIREQCRRTVRKNWVPESYAEYESSTCTIPCI
jgi:hypothetical protein